MKKNKNKYRPSRVFIDQFKNVWSSKELANYYSTEKDASGMQFAVIFTEPRVEELTQSLFKASIKARAAADNILKKDKNKIPLTKEDESYLYVTAAKFTKALSDANVYEIFHETNVASDNPSLYFAVAATNQAVRKAAKCKSFRKHCGKEYNKEFWARPEDIIYSPAVPGLTKLEDFIVKHKLINIQKMWNFFEKTVNYRNIISVLLYKEAIPAGIIENDRIPSPKLLG